MNDLTEEKHNEALKRYFSTEKGKQARYRASKKWANNHKDKVYEYNKKYLSTEQGKAKKREQNRRYREKLKQKSELLQK